MDKSSQQTLKQLIVFNIAFWVILFLGTGGFGQASGDNYFLALALIIYFASMVALVPMAAYKMFMYYLKNRKMSFKDKTFKSLAIVLMLIAVGVYYLQRIIPTS